MNDLQADNDADRDKQKPHTKRPYLQFIFLTGFDSLPHSDIPDADPAISSTVVQHSDAQAPEFLCHFRFDSAISDFPMVAPRSIIEILTEHSPGCVIVAVCVVGTDELVGRWRSLSKSP